MTRVLPRIPLDPTQEADLRERVLAYLASYPGPALIMTRGLDGAPRYRLMGVRRDGFKPYLVSIKPSAKLAQLQANPEVNILWYRYDANDDQSDQPLRLVSIIGQAELVMHPAGIRAFPGHDQNMDDEELERTRFGAIIHPQTVRVEGFFPGPRYPIFLKP